MSTTEVFFSFPQIHLDIYFSGTWNLRTCHCKEAVRPGLASHTCAPAFRSTQSLHYTVPGMGVPENAGKDGPKGCSLQVLERSNVSGRGLPGHGYSLQSGSALSSSCSL